LIIGSTNQTIVTAILVSNGMTKLVLAASGLLTPIRKATKQAIGTKTVCATRLARKAAFKTFDSVLADRAIGTSSVDFVGATKLARVAAFPTFAAFADQASGTTSVDVRVATILCISAADSTSTSVNTAHQSNATAISGAAKIAASAAA
jgi:hypothetical protein